MCMFPCQYSENFSIIFLLILCNLFIYFAFQPQFSLPALFPFSPHALTQLTSPLFLFRKRQALRDILVNQKTHVLLQSHDGKTLRNTSKSTLLYFLIRNSIAFEIKYLEKFCHFCVSIIVLFHIMMSQ